MIMFNPIGVAKKKASSFSIKKGYDRISMFPPKHEWEDDLPDAVGRRNCRLERRNKRERY